MAGVFVADASEWNYLMLDHVKALIVEARLDVDVRSIRKINVTSVVIGGIMLAIVGVLKEEGAGHTLLLGLVHVHTAAVAGLVRVLDHLHVPVQGLLCLAVSSPSQDLAVDKQSVY